MSENFKSFQSLSALRDKSISQNFFNFFEIIEKVGEGAHSVVYKCREYKSGSIYAVKQTKKKDPEFIANMRNSYEILKNLSHQSIAQGKMFFVNDKKLTCYLVTELV